MDSAYGKAFAKAYVEIKPLHPNLLDVELRPLVEARTEQILEVDQKKYVF